MIYLPDAKMIDPVTGVQSNNDGVILQYKSTPKDIICKRITIFPADRTLLEKLQKAKLSELTGKITLESVRE